MASRPTARQVLMTLWHLQEVVRSHGWWHTFLVSLQFLGASLLPGGIVYFRHLAQEVSVDTSKVAWMHSLRRAWRIKLMALAYEAQPGIFPSDPEFLDWDILGDMLSLYPRLAITYSRGVNTKDRARRHFGLQVSTQCEHGCREPDSVCHRVVSCKALEPRRQAHGIDHLRCSSMARRPLYTQECCLWTIPDSARVWCQAKSVQNLLITPNLLQRVMDAISQTSSHDADTWTLRVRYSRKKYGDHPLLSARAIEVQVDRAPSLSLFALGPCKACTRRCWEAQIVLIAALLHQGSRKLVHLHGLLTPVASIAQDFAHGKAPSSYMRHNVEDAIDGLLQESYEKNCDQSATLQASLDAQVQPAVGPLSLSWKEALAWSSIFADSFDYYPQAHNLSRSHGNGLGVRPLNLESVPFCLRGHNHDCLTGNGPRLDGGSGSSSFAFGANDSPLNWPTTCSASSLRPC